MCVLIFSITFVLNTSPFVKNWVTYDQTCVLVCRQSACYCCQILMKLDFLNRFLKIVKHQISLNSVQWELNCPFADGQTDLTKLIVTFDNFANTPKIWYSKTHLGGHQETKWEDLGFCRAQFWNHFSVSDANKIEYFLKVQEF